MKHKFRSFVYSLILFLSIFLVSCKSIENLVFNSANTDLVQITGHVVLAADEKPVSDALVTVRASEYQATTNADGYFKLSLPPIESEVEITAWAPGFYIAHTYVQVPSRDVKLALRPYHKKDHSDYEWLDPTPSEESETACGNCHPMILPQWQNNAHGEAIDNPRFFSFYNGTDIQEEEMVSPGYSLDFPGTSGNCSTCHAPGAAVDAPFSTDMNAIRGQLTAGIHCDFCHKVGGIYQNSTKQSPYANMPGVFSMMVLRPPPGEQIFVGPYPDIHDPDTYLPIMSESAFCAPCHQFSFWGTSIYNSYGEWLESPYSDPESGQTCQDCHMLPTGDEYFALPEQGGIPHPPEKIPSHLQLGITDEDFMQNSIEMQVNVEEIENRINVQVTLTNTDVGHHIPTDHPGRHLLLVVEAIDEEGKALLLQDGPIIPSWGGNYAELPGSIYAKLLQDVETGKFPVVSYWKQTLIVSDNRIPAMEKDITNYIFKPSDKSVTIQVRVLFRRLYQPIAERYGWELGEIVMEEKIIKISP